MDDSPAMCVLLTIRTDIQEVDVHGRVHWGEWSGTVIRRPRLNSWPEYGVWTQIFSTFCLAYLSSEPDST
jgi:hypothetical protein